MTDCAEALLRANERIAELEAQLRENEPRLRLFQNALDLMCVAGTDGYFKQLNPSWTTVLGWSIEELTSVPYLDFVHPDDAEATRGVARSLAAGSGVVAFQNRYRHRDGSYRWLSWNAVVDATEVRVLAVARDVTDIIETRQALKASEDAYKHLFDGMLDGFSYHDMIFDEAGEPLDYRFRAVNPAFEEMTGLKAADIVGRRVLEVLPGTEKHWIEASGGVTKTGIPLRYEAYSQEFDKWFEVLLFRPVPGQFGCTFHDVTARKKAEAERAHLQAKLEYTQKLEGLGVMAGGIAHDFNNLLTVILGGIELAIEAIQDPGAVKDELMPATAAAERARDLCRQMLAYAGRAEPCKAAADLSALTREILPLAGPSLSKKVRLHTEFPETPLRVLLDHSQLTQVILNLLINAGDAIGDAEGDIHVRTGVREFADSELMSFTEAGGLESGSYAFVEVRDSGVGMSSETITKIFDPFFTTKATGRGLGLAATLGIVRAHRGGMLVQSEPGQGSCFLCALPLASDAVVAQPDAAKQSTLRATGTVLVVDDEPAVRRIAARMVNSLGFDVLEASDGAQAIEFLANNASGASAVLLDMMMPKMGGLDVLPLLRERRHDLPIVLMSGFDESRLAGGLSDENLTFLQKPFRRDQLARALDHLFEGRVSG
ncbi:MAG TPA: PAS domain S-box protein [Polyangiales bacterium]|nr:PAS domain S-box protein [Polyangiales bacterium]